MFVRIPVSWEMCGWVEVETKADNIDDAMKEAIEIFNDTMDDIPLPDDASYVDGSFEMSCEEDQLEIYQ